MRSQEDLAIEAAINQDWNKAILINLQVLQQQPQHTPSLNRLAKAYKELGEIEKAISIYQQVLDLDPFNTIAKKNIKNLSQNQFRIKSNNCYIINFIEDPGKTKTIQLTRIGNHNALSTVQPGLIVELVVKKHCIAIHNGDEYIGAIPDDISYKLKPYIEGGSVFQTAIKSINENEVFVFIREIKKALKFNEVITFMI